MADRAGERRPGHGAPPGARPPRRQVDRLVGSDGGGAAGGEPSLRGFRAPVRLPAAAGSALLGRTGRLLLRLLERDRLAPVSRSHSAGELRPDLLAAYETVNERFADAILGVAKP